MSKMMPNITNKLRRKKPSVTVESPSGKEPDAKESKSLVKAATGLLRTAVRAPPPVPPAVLDAPGIRTSSLPQARRSSVDKANLPPELNAYMKGKVPKGEPSTYLELLRFMGELRSAGEKGQRQLLTIILPRLAQMENLPASLIPQLLQILSTGSERRLSRFVHYLLQTTLGPGSAGAPSATPGPAQNAALEINKDVASKAWPSVLDPIVDSLIADNELRTLSAAARGSEGRHDKELAQAVRAALDRAASSPLQGPASAKRGGRKSPGTDTWDPQWGALSAARAALRGKALRETATKGMDGILSQEPTVARHALAVALHLAQHNAPQLLDTQKDLATVVAATCGMYEASGHVAGGDSKKQPPNKLAALQASVNISDKWARVYLARLCSAILYADWTSTQEFAKGQGKPFWTMLILLATRDKEDLVVVEAIKALFGSLPSASAPIFAAVPVPEDSKRDIRLKARAWKLVSHEAKQTLPAIPGGQSSEPSTLMGTIGISIRRGLLGNSCPLVSAACRAVGAMLEARAHAGPGSSEAERVASILQLALGDALQGDMAPVERSHALSALIWAQGPDAVSGAVARHVKTAKSAEDASPQVWSADLLQSLVVTCHRALRALPAAAPNLLATVNALAAVSPTAVTADALFGLWTAALTQGTAGKSAAFHAALQLLSSQQPAQNTLAKASQAEVAAQAAEDAPRTELHRGRGWRMDASQAEVAAQAAEDAAWTELQRCTAWWLGEFLNTAAGETAGHKQPETPEDEHNGEDTAGLSAAETLALKALRNPLVAATISHLQHACLTSPWTVRVASAQALAKVAVRSNEPYRLQCYGFLSAVASIGGLGLTALVRPALDVMDKLYSSQMMLEKLARQHGDLPNKWPPAVAQQLRQRHNALACSIEKHICSLSDDCYPIGPRSKGILTSGLERLASGEELPSAHKPAAPAERRSSGFGNRVDSDVDSDEELSYDEYSQPGTARLASMPTSPILNGSDALADLTRNLDDQMRMDALKQQRGPSPFQHTTFDTEPSYSLEEENSGYSPQHAEAEQPAFEFMERESDWELPQHARSSSADKVHYVNGPGEVLHAFDAEAAEELSVYAGEEVEVVAEVDGWLHCVASNGAKGLVPSSYVRLLGAGESSGLYQQSSAMPSQQSLDPLAQPDLLAALTAQAKEPSNSWMSFDDNDAASAGPFHQGSVASSAFDNKSMGAASGQEDWSTRFETDFGETAAEASTASADHGKAPVPELSLQDIDAAIDKEMASPQLQGSRQSPGSPAAPAQGSSSQPPIAQRSVASPRGSEGEMSISGRVSSPREQLASLASRTPRGSFSGAPVTPSRHSRGGSMEFGGSQVAALRRNSFADAAGSPRMTPRHSRNSSIEVLANAAAFVRPYKAHILYGFEAETEDELTVFPGDAVTVQVEVEGWVQITRDKDGQKGLVPASYLEQS